MASTEKNKLDRIKNRLLQCLAEGAGPQEILDEAYRILGNPLHLCDNAQRLVAHAGRSENPPSFWAVVDRLGFIPQSNHPHVAENAAYQKVLTATLEEFRQKQYVDTIVVIPREDGCRTMSSVLWSGGRIVGSMHMLEDHTPFDDYVTGLFKLICRCAAFLLAEQPTNPEGWSRPYESLLTWLLTENNIKNSTLRGFAQSIMPEVQPNLAILTVVASPSDREGKRLAEAINRLLPNSKHLFLGDVLTFLVYDAGAEALPAKVRPALEELLRSCGIKMGVSNLFTDICAANLAYQQSRNAVLYGARTTLDKYILHYSDHLPHHFLDALPDKTQLLNYCDPGLLRLMDTDLAKGSEYTKTLYWYIHCAGDTAAAARHLNIHYNTVRFRMQKIRSLLISDRLDFGRQLLLTMSFSMLELMGDPRLQICMKSSDRGDHNA